MSAQKSVKELGLNVEVIDQTYDSKVADMSQAEFGRKELDMAEVTGFVVVRFHVVRSTFFFAR